MAIIYQCDHCHFAFERAGAVENCPDCGSASVRSATDSEQANYMRIKAELASTGCQNEQVAK